MVERVKKDYIKDMWVILWTGQWLCPLYDPQSQTTYICLFAPAKILIYIITKILLYILVFVLMNIFISIFAQVKTATNCAIIDSVDKLETSC